MNDKIILTSISNCGLFMGFTADPSDNSQLGDNPKESIEEKEVKAIFHSYKSFLKESAIQYGLSETDIDDQYETLYEPEVWHISGYFSKLYISLVDDFIFGSRHFRPFNTIININKHQNFDTKEYKLPKTSFLYQSQVGLYYDQKNNLDEKYKFIKSQQYSFISITNVKLNNGYLIGNGLIFSSLVIKKIAIELKNFQLDGLILLTLGWNELCLIMYSNDPSNFLNMLNQIRAWTLNDLFKICTEEEKNYILENCLISNKKFNKNSDKPYTVEDGHVISHSYTYYGYKNVELLCDISSNLSYRTVFYVKPGHGQTLHDEIIKPLFPSGSPIPKVVIGNGDLVYEFSGTQMMSIINNLDKINQHIDKYFTSPQHQIDKIGKLVSNNHPYYYSVLNQLQFNKQLLSDLYDTFDKLGISSNVRSRFMNIYVKYQHACRDPIMYSFFIDLQQVLIGIADCMTKPLFINDFKNVSELSNYLLDFSYNFEQSLFSRYGTSYDMSEVPDWNMDFSGGLQSILSSFEFNYKLLESFCIAAKQKYLLNNLNSQNNQNSEINQMNLLSRSFIFLSSKSGNKSMDYALRIDAFHIYQSEFYAMVLWKEISNWLLTEDEFTQLINKKEIHPDKKVIFRDLHIDLIHFRTQFFNNWELYSYWFFGTICQDSNIYDFKGEIEEESAQLFIHRYLLVKHFIIGLDEDDSDFFSKIHPFKDIYFSNIFKIRQRHLDFIGNNYRILKLIDDESQKHVLSIFGIKIIKPDNFNKNMLFSGFFNAYNQIPIDNNFCKVIDFVNNISVSTSPEIMQKTFTIFKLTYEAYQLLNSIYLKAYKTNTENINYIKHKEIFSSDYTINDNYFQFHQLGGAYCYFPQLRKDLLQLRVKYLLNLWGEAQIHKKQQIIELIN
ncbi:MAG: hypothetical protein LKG19_03485 [Saprospiraceae bacterium]|jgi:hypothetical protein|nr:hypothetical protein [Saprospiraceae bacterium]